MKCFLLFLATGLVTSDKLDRNYLPPPGSQYSGGTLDDLSLPLEYPKETFTERNQYLPGYALDKIRPGFSANQDIPIIPANYLSSTAPNNFSLMSSSPTLGYNFVTTTSLPYFNLYNSFPPTAPNLQYLPSKPSSFDSQSYPGPTSSSGFKKSPDFTYFRPNVDRKDDGYYNFVPSMFSYRNNVVTKMNNNGFLLNNKYIPNQMTNDIVQNYQPSAFGYYGGNPMIMTSQNLLPQDNNNKELISKLKGSQIQVPASLINYQQENYKMLSTLPPTPLEQTNLMDTTKPIDSTTLPNVPKQLQFSSSATRSFSKDNNLQTIPAERNENNFRPRIRPLRPQAEKEKNAVIINYENNISPEGYSYSYDTSNGIHADESATATNGVRAKGSYSYTGDDGKVYTVTYTADENGFRPTGDHLPTPPPIPEAIQKVIEQAARDKAAGIVDDGSYDERKYGHLNYHHDLNQYLPLKNSRAMPSKFKNNKIIPNNLANSNNNQLQYSKIPPLTTAKGLKSIERVNKNKYFNQRLPDANKNKDSFVNTLLLQENKDENDEMYDNISSNVPQKQKLNRRPITSVPNEYEKNDEITSFKTPKPQLNTKRVDKTNDKNKIIQNRLPEPVSRSRGSFNDDGYLYVPPIIKFSPETEPLETSKRTSYNDEQKSKNLDNTIQSTELPSSQNTVATESTRKPYISGPNDLDKDNYYSTESNYPVSNSQDFALYEQSTTPITMLSVDHERRPIVDYTQYDQSSTNPSSNLNEVVPSAKNRIGIPIIKPGISVSQDFVTTVRPPTFKDGVLEVNQNVKIYGIGKPTTAATSSEYPEISGNTNNALTIPVPSGETTGFLYPDNVSGIIQDTGVIQEFPDQNAIYPGGNQGIDFGDTNSPNYSNSEVENQGYQFQIPDIPFTTGTFGVPEPTSGQEQIIPKIPQNQRPNKEFVGEDFSGPKQPQKYDPASGYYYK